MDRFGQQEAWWNRPSTEPQQQSAPASEPAQIPLAEDTRAVVRQELLTQAQAYDQWAIARRGQYEEATQKFLADTEIAPYFKVAEQYFTQLNDNSGQKMPVAQLFDMTVQHVRGLKNMGVAPPKAPAAPRGGFPAGGNGWDAVAPDGTPNRGGGFRPENPEEVLKQKQQYLTSRRLDLELRRDRSTPEDEIINAAVSRASSSMLNLQAS